MQLLIILALVMLGLIFGSFGSVIFFRLGELPGAKTLKDFLIGRSKCGHCHHTLHTPDLVPLRSFFSQKGKCRYCRKALSRRYPVLEMGTVLIFLGVYAAMLKGGVLEGGMQGSGLRECGLTALGLWLLFIILLYDLKEYTLHLTATLLLLILSFCAQGALGYDLLSTLKFGLIFFCLFLIIYFLARCYVVWKYQQKAEGFWFGDVLAAGVLGSLLATVMPTTLREEMYLICIYLILSCLIGLLHFVVSLVLQGKMAGRAGGRAAGRAAGRADGRTVGRAVGRTVGWEGGTPPEVEVAQQGGKVIPFLPAMIIAFVIIMIRGHELLSSVMASLDAFTALLFSL